MLRLVTILVALGALASGCTDATLIERDICGNFVLETGEDCDTPESWCVSCRVACALPLPSATDTSPTAPLCEGTPDGTCCPGGMSCGNDNQCRAPTGTFQAPLSSAFEVYGFGIADLDRDHADDLLGASTGNIIALYGGAELPLTSRVARSMPSSSGPIGIGDYTGDANPDIVVPTNAGIVTFESSTGVPEPVAFPFISSQDRVHISAAAIVPGLYRLDQVNGEVRAVLGPAPLGRPCDIAFDIGRVPSPVLRPYEDRTISGTGRTVIPIAIASDGTNPAQLCVEVIGTGTDFAFPLSIEDSFVTFAPPFFAELDVSGSQCPELLIPVEACDAPGQNCQPVTVAFAGTGTRGACTLDRNTLPRLIPGSAMAVITLQRSLAPAVRAVVTNYGLWDANGTYTSTQYDDPIIAGSSGWAGGVTGDFDNDGLEDFAVFVPGLDDILVYEQRPFATVQQWRLLHIPTTGFLYMAAAGDFDGDGFTDIAYASLRSITELYFPPPDADVSIAFGSASTFTPARRVSQVKDLIALSASQIPEPNTQPGFDQYDDLVVTHGGVDGQTRGKVSVFYGSANQVLVAPWRDPGGRPANGALVGQFGTNGGAAILAGFSDRETPTETIAGGLLRLVHSVDTLLPDPVALDADALVDDAVFINISSSSGDMMLMFQQSAQRPDLCGSYLRATDPPRLRRLACSDFLDASVPAEARTAVQRVRAVHDVGDGRLLLTSDLDDDTTLLYMWKLEVVDGVPYLKDPVSLGARYATASGSSDECYAVISAELGERVVDGQTYGANEREAVLACVTANPADPLDFELHLDAMFRGPAGGPDVVTRIADRLELFQTLAVADVNGDGLDDLLTHAIIGSVNAFIQCDRDDESCEGK